MSLQTIEYFGLSVLSGRRVLKIRPALMWTDQWQSLSLPRKIMLLDKAARSHDYGKLRLTRNQRSFPKSHDAHSRGMRRKA